MRLYVDTILKEEAIEAIKTGFVYGITSNPFLFSKNSKSFMEIVEELYQFTGNEFHVQVPGRNAEELFKNGIKVFELDPKRIVIKIPMCYEGIKAMKLLKEVGIRVTATAITTVQQAIISAIIGVDYVAPFVARVEEAGGNGIALIEKISRIFHRNKVKTLILAASIRTPTHVIMAFSAGADAVTIKFNLLKDLIESPLSINIINQMNEIWSKIPLGL